MTLDEKALEAAARAVLHRRIKPDFFEVKDGAWRLDHDKVIAAEAIAAYLQALEPPKMVKLMPEDEQLLEKALRASSPAIYEIVPGALRPGSTGEAEGWRPLMKELADELEVEIDSRYPRENRHYPSIARKANAAMEPVRQARAMLAAAGGRDE